MTFMHELAQGGSLGGGGNARLVRRLGTSARQV